MQTVIDNLNDKVNEIQNLLEDLLRNHSTIYKRNTDILITPYGYTYKELGEKGRQIQAKLLEEYRRFNDLLTVLLKDQPKDTIRELLKTNKDILRIIEQDSTSCRNTQEALDRGAQALQTQFKLLSRLYDSSNDEATYIPDTNALIYNPDLETWSFSETPKFTVVLLPTVLSELDSLKINHRNEAVRKKAEKLIRKLKEYRRRGRLPAGVSLVRDKTKIQAVALEPNIEDSLPWLDASSNDDRILAGVIEVMRTRPRSPVMAVSRDINFQNKADFANIPVVEPPEPT